MVKVIAKEEKTTVPAESEIMNPEFSDKILLEKLAQSFVDLRVELKRLKLYEEDTLKNPLLKALQDHSENFVNVIGGRVSLRTTVTRVFTDKLESFLKSKKLFARTRKRAVAPELLTEKYLKELGVWEKLTVEVVDPEVVMAILTEERLIDAEALEVKTEYSLACTLTKTD